MKLGPKKPLLAFQLIVCNLCLFSVIASPLDSKHAKFAANSDYQEAPRPNEIDSKVAISDLVAQESPLEFSGYSDAGELLDKRQSFNPWGGKRSAFAEDLVKRPFSPWGGKRGFNPWGGKRAFSPWGGKRAFSPWGGKRNAEEVEEEKRGFNPWGGKRAFSPWGGKRSADDVEEDEEKRGFNPWGGKRAFSPWGGKRDAQKRGFNPWGGKRSDVSDKRGFNPWGGKRGFNPWGGKRNTEVIPESQGGHHIVKRSTDLSALDKYSKGDILLAYALMEELQRLQENKEKDEKRSFNPWGGKREFNPWGGKRAFNPWGGKRAFSPWGGKRAFNPWGGKRSEDSEEYLRSEDEEDEVSEHKRFVREATRRQDQQTQDDTKAI